MKVFLLGFYICMVSAITVRLFPSKTTTTTTTISTATTTTTTTTPEKTTTTAATTTPETTTTTTSTKITTDLTNFTIPQLEPKIVYITKGSIVIILCIQDHFSLNSYFLI